MALIKSIVAKIQAICEELKRHPISVGFMVMLSYLCYHFCKKGGLVSLYGGLIVLLVVAFLCVSYYVITKTSKRKKYLFILYATFLLIYFLDFKVCKYITAVFAYSQLFLIPMLVLFYYISQFGKEHFAKYFYYLIPFYIASPILPYVIFRLTGYLNSEGGTYFIAYMVIFSLVSVLLYVVISFCILAGYKFPENKTDITPQEINFARFLALSVFSSPTVCWLIFEILGFIKKLMLLS